MASAMRRSMEATVTSMIVKPASGPGGRSGSNGGRRLVGGGGFAFAQVDRHRQGGHRGSRGGGLGERVGDRPEQRRSGDGAGAGPGARPAAVGRVGEGLSAG